MGLFSKKEGYVTKGQRKITEGRTPEGVQVVLDGLNDYQNKITACVNEFPKNDAALIVTALRALADFIENDTPSCKPLIAWIKGNVKPPMFTDTNKELKTKQR